jgi:hypothetical protein
LIVRCSGVYGVPQHARADWRLPSAKTSGCEAEAVCADRTKGPLSAPLAAYRLCLEQQQTITGCFCSVWGCVGEKGDCVPHPGRGRFRGRDDAGAKVIMAVRQVRGPL